MITLTFGCLSHVLDLLLLRGLYHLDLRLSLLVLNLWLLRGFDHLDLWFPRLLLLHLNFLLVGCLNDLNLGWLHILDNFDHLLFAVVYNTYCGLFRFLDNLNFWCMLFGHLDDLHFLALKPRNFYFSLLDLEAVCLDRLFAILNLRISVRDVLLEVREAVCDDSFRLFVVLTALLVHLHYFAQTISSCQ